MKGWGEKAAGADYATRVVDCYGMSIWEYDESQFFFPRALFMPHTVLIGCNVCVRWKQYNDDQWSEIPEDDWEEKAC